MPARPSRGALRRRRVRRLVGDQVRGRRARAARSETLFESRQRRHHGPGHGHRHPRHGRRGTPPLPQPRRPCLSALGPGPLGERAHRPHHPPPHRRPGRSRRGRRRRRSGGGDHQPIPGAGHRRRARRAVAGPRTVPHLGPRHEQRPRRLPGLHCGVGGHARVPDTDRRGPQGPSHRRPHLRHRHRRDGRRAPQRRAHLRVPAAVAPRRRRDHVRGHGELLVRAVVEARSARSRAEPTRASSMPWWKRRCDGRPR